MSTTAALLVDHVIAPDVTLEGSTGCASLRFVEVIETLTTGSELRRRDLAAGILSS